MLRLGFVSLAYWRHHVSRLLSNLTVASLLIGVTVAAGLVELGMQKTIRSMTGDATGEADLQIVASSEDGMLASLLDMNKDERFDIVAPVLLRQSLVLAGGKRQSVNIKGIDPELDQEIRQFSLVEGRRLDSLDKRAVVISSDLAQEMQIAYLDHLDLLTPQGLQDYIIVGIYQSKEGDQSQTIFSTIKDVQAGFTSGLNMVSWFDVQLEPGSPKHIVKADFEAQFGLLARVVLPGERASEVRKTLGTVRVSLWLIVILTAAACLYLLVSNLLLMLIERRETLGLLHVLGLRYKQVFAFLATEVFVYLILAWGLGTWVAQSLSSVLVKTVSNNVLVSSTLLIYDSVFWPLGVILGFGVCMVIFFVMMLPLSKTLNKKPFSKPQDVSSYRGIEHIQFASGMGLLIMTVLPGFIVEAPFLLLGQSIFLLVFMLSIAFGLPKLSSFLGTYMFRSAASPSWLWLSAGLLKKFRRRSAVALASLMLSLSVLTAVFATVQSYRISLDAWTSSMFDWDLIVSQQDHEADVPLNGELRWELATLPGVAVVSSDYQTLIRQGDLIANLYVFDMQTFSHRRQFKSVSGIASESLPRALSEGRRVAIAKSLATLYNFDTNSRINLTTPTGEHVYDVVAVVDDVGAASRGMFIDQTIYQQDWQHNTAGLFSIALETKANREEVALLIREHLSPQYAVNVQSASEFQEDMTRLIRSSFGFGQGMVLIFVFIAALGLINMGLEHMYHLRKDFAILRALGARVSLIKQMFIAETLIGGLFAAVSALLFGTLLSQVIVRGLRFSTRYTIEWYWPIDTYGILLLVSIGVLVFVSFISLRILLKGLGEELSA